LERLIELAVNHLEKKKLISDQMFNFFDSEATKFRPSLIISSKSRDSYGLINHLIVDPVSSEDEREDDDMEPSVREVSESIFDINTIIQVEVKFF
jgi:hypothetical protein